MGPVAEQKGLSDDEPDAVCISDLEHAYGERLALAGVSFRVKAGEIFGLLGPNGGGKTTLFRLLTTYYPVQSGSAAVFGLDVSTRMTEVRRNIGVVFQSPSLDDKLTVEENLKHHARLYGVPRQLAKRRADELLGRLGLSDRKRERVERLSGGLARRAELAKGMLHQPRLLILDEPSTGLDPGGRRDLWSSLVALQEDGVTVLLTTHFMEEAAKCDRLGILDRGKLVAEGTPDDLCAQIGGEVVTLKANDPLGVQQALKESLGVDAELIDDQLRFESENGVDAVAKVAALAGHQFASISVAKPTLEDVFLQRTGHQFWDSDQ